LENDGLAFLPYSQTKGQPMSTDYTPPKVWKWEQPSGGTFASINRPVAGATHDKALQVGEHPLQLYSLATPNGVKVTILLEELLEAGHDAEYDAWLIDIGKGDQFGSGFVEVNPNSKIPALMDHGATPPQRVFESASIMLYLAEKFGAFIPKDPAARTEMFSWLFWQMGSAPFVGGGFGHFYAYAPPCRQGLDGGRGIHPGRHGDLGVVWQPRAWPRLQRRRIPGCRQLQTRPRLGRTD
jgi:GSH-dependent disulfide-bond oxidoreductase